MDRQIQRLLNRVSFVCISIATITLVLLFSKTPETCLIESTNTKHQIRFPKSSCESTHRELVSLEKKNKRTWSTNTWRNNVKSFAEFFHQIQTLNLLGNHSRVLGNHSRVLCISAGAGQEVMALRNMGVSDVTGVELVDSPPLVSRADPHNLPFFDDVFDLGFSAHFSEALFPTRFVVELERTVRPGGVCVLVVEECSSVDLGEIKSLFKSSSFIGASNVTLVGTKMTRIIMRVGVPP